MRKKWTFLKSDPGLTHYLQQSLGIHPVVAAILVQRGITDPVQASTFLNPNLNHLHDPFRMHGMNHAVPRLIQAVESKEKILLYGDYDVDGITSIVLMFEFLEKLGAEVDFYLPDRYSEGYGVSDEGISYAVQKGVGLLITLDCGMQATRQIESARALGIDTIICDHHQAGETLPPAVAVLNPKQPNCLYPFKELSGCGIAFKLIQALMQVRPEWAMPLEPMLEWVVLSIAADLVELTGENRILAFFGLQAINRSRRPGVNALIEQSRRTRPLRINDIVYGLGPLINAAGRMADAGKAVQLLLAKHPHVAADYARVLTYRNNLRREYDRTMAREATGLWEAQPGHSERRSIVLYQSHWHKGIAGIAAARMVDKYQRPAVILTGSKEKAVGSARSVPGVDLYKILSGCKDLLINFGGHQYAAGLSILPEYIPAFSDRMEALIQIHYPQVFQATFPIAVQMDWADIDGDFWEDYKKLAPFGPGNRTPVFASMKVESTGASQEMGDNHLRCTLVQEGFAMPCIGFSLYQTWVACKGHILDVCYTLDEQEWRGSAFMRLELKDIRTHKYSGVTIQ